MTVSSPRARGNQVGLSSFFDTGDTADLDEGNDNEVTKDSLTTKQCAVLEFFIAKLRLRSQKQLKYWAMVPPLATHSRGHMKNPTNHPLHGAGCDNRTLWNTLNDLFDSTFDARNDTISRQFTVSMAFDNWQQMITKKWQSNGCSSLYLKGVASFLKKDKVVLIPVGSVLKSPSGCLFRVTSSQFIDAYLTVIRGGPVINELSVR